MEQELLDRQISIKEKEDCLRIETQTLLVDLLTRMTDKQKNSLRGYTINDDYTIWGKITDSDFEVEEYDGKVSLREVDDLSQSEQKDLIDFIIENNLAI